MVASVLVCTVINACLVWRRSTQNIDIFLIYTMLFFRFMFSHVNSGSFKPKVKCWFFKWICWAEGEILVQ